MTPEVIKEIYAFGGFLIAEGIGRTAHLESKATIVVGYSGAILAFLLVRLPASAQSLSNWAALPAVLALLLGFATVRIHGTKWFGDDIWIPQQLASAHPDEQLRLHYFEAIFEINQEIKSTNQVKGNLLFFAQWLLLIAVLIIGWTLLSELRHATIIWNS
jgi:lysylphosphatidylglycerol synthetase-like protein (DUF2156 family)